jgi:hypothetical protein
MQAGQAEAGMQGERFSDINPEGCSGRQGMKYNQMWRMKDIQTKACRKILRKVEEYSHTQAERYSNRGTGRIS